ncbi:MAG: OmpH family outer membrane protein [Alphaproteobacteria bacterium]
MLQTMKKMAILSVITFSLTLFSFTAESLASLEGIAVVDVEKVMAKSNAGKDFKKKLASMKKKLESSLTKKEEALKKKEEAILKNSKDMKKEDFLKKKKAFLGEFQKARTGILKEKAKLDKAVVSGRVQLKKALMKSVGQLAQKENYRIVMTKSQVVLYDKKMDVTDKILALFNKNLSRVNLSN